MPAESWTCSRSLARLRQLRLHIEHEVDAAARALGYYQLRIEALSFQKGNECWQLTLKIDPGPRTRITTVNLRILGEAAQDPEFERLHRNLPIRPGTPLHHGQYEQLKLQFKHLALQRGYFDAHFSRHELKVDLRRNTAAINLVFDSGPRYVIGPITIHQDFLDPDFVARYFHIHPGQPYRAASLAELHRRLADSGYFREIRLQTRPQHRPHLQVPVTVTLEPKKRYQYRIGVGFETNTGPRFSSGYRDRYLNRQGHRFNADLHLSFVDSSLSTSYLVPLDDPLTETLRLSTGLRHQNLDTFTSNQAVLRVAYAHPRGPWNETWSLSLNYERSRSGKTAPVESLLLLPGSGWSYKKIQKQDRRIIRGHKFDFTLQGGITLIGDTTQFLRARLWGKYVWPLPWPARVIHRWELGALGTPHFANVPASFRFYAGGDTSIRGYGYQRLGPKNEDGKVVGGRYLVVASLEYEQMVWNHWALAAFVDGGNAYGHLQGWWRASRFGAGLGLRWFSPVGLVRLDVATPLTAQAPEIRIHFAIGALL